MEQKTPAGWKRGFYTIFAGQTVSLIGSSAVQFALIWWLASGTDSPMMLALSSLVVFLPQLLLGPFAGVWIDRLSRKKVAIAADLFMGFCALAFALVFLAGRPPYWAALLAMGARAVGSVFHTPSIQAITPLLVPQEELMRANGVNQFLQSGAFMLGPVLGAAMFATLPMWAILLTDTLGAVVASSLMLIVPIPELPPKEGEAAHFFDEMKGGLAALMRQKPLWLLTLCATACMAFFLPLSSYYPLMTSSYFRASAWHASIVELAYAGGMMLFAALMGSVGDKAKNPLAISYLGLLGLGLTSLFCGLLPATAWAFWVFMILCGLMGGCGNVYSIPYMATLQRSIPPEAQGRVFSLIGSLMSLAMPVGLLLSGPAAERIGVHGWFFITGAAVCLITLVCFLWNRGLRND
ncbi:MAG: MFS transporter [Candidatus Pelethousia sp.]|nr:MFS transporter [Candidatus Pelethousia sp.]